MEEWERVAGSESAVVLPVQYLLLVIRHPLFHSYTLHICESSGCKRISNGLYPGLEVIGFLQESGTSADVGTATELLISRCDYMAFKTRGRSVQVYVKCADGTAAELAALQKRARSLQLRALASLS